MSSQAYAQVFSQTHSIIFMSDNMRNTLREVIRENGISPNKLMQDWDTIERGIRTWLESGHLNNVVVEFFKPGALETSARWEFPVGYTDSGVDDDMWLDKNYLCQLIAKAKRPTSDCTYRIILCTDKGAPAVSGFTSCSFLSTGQMYTHRKQKHDSRDARLLLTHLCLLFDREPSNDATAGCGHLYP